MEATIWIIALLVNIIFSGIVAYVASEKGRSAGAFFALSFFFSFLVGILVVMAVPAISSQPIRPSPSQNRRQLKTCEHCAEEIKREAKVCKHCGRDVEVLEASVEPEIFDSRNWCNKCKETSFGSQNSACPSCGNTTYPWDGIS